jgi:pilus assembly protein CpaB
MKVARVVVLGVAIAAGGLAFMLSGREAPPPVQQIVRPAQETVDVLVAKKDISIGQAISLDDLAWQPWPISAAGPLFIRKNERPDAIDEMKGAVARAPFVAGEPIREQKLVRAGNAGFMSAILKPGMRAISTDINPETGVGGFVLPNDHVDVILTRRVPDAQRQGGTDGFVSETVLRNVRVLAIDQTVEEKGGQKVVVGKTATLELTAKQAETLVVSRQRGTLSLALRSLADSRTNTTTERDPSEDSVTIWRGVQRETWSCADQCKQAGAQ